MCTWGIVGVILCCLMTHSSCNPAALAQRPCFVSFVCSAFDYDTENMNSEDIYSSLKGVTEAIQNFSVRSQEDMNDPVQRREGEEVSRKNGWMTYVVMRALLLFLLNIPVNCQQHPFFFLFLFFLHS